MAASLFGQQRIPRQTTPATAAVQGVFRNPLGLGLGGVRVRLLGISGGAGREASTTGDGVFRMIGLRPGRYRLDAELAGFEPFEREFDLKAGDSIAVEQILKPLPKEPKPAPVPETIPGYRSVPQTDTAEAIIAQPAEAIPTEDKVFAPVPNRWKYDWPDYRRYNVPGDVQYVKGHFYDPFNQNRLKGDSPLFGQTFLKIDLVSDTFADPRKLPVGTGPSNASPDRYGFFGRFGQFAMSENLSFSADLFHGDTSFKPVDWRIKFTPEINLNYVDVQEVGVVNIDVRKGTTRYDTHVGLQEAFVEAKIADLSHAYDFVSARAGIQTFNSDFRGFIFFDQEPGLRIFGNFDSNRYQYNAAYFAMLEKDANSGLNTMQYRNQQVMIANVYRQDFFRPGYTIQASFHYDKDDASLEYDVDHFLVRPSPIGAVKPHSVRAYYYGL